VKRPAQNFVVVGAGSAGCSLAARLTERARHSILFLEADGEDCNLWIYVSLGVGKLLADERYAWKFETDPQAAVLGQRIFWPRGKVLGGSSALNGMAYVWGEPAEYDVWCADGCPGGSFSDVQPYFRRPEGNAHSDDAWPRHGGPVKITALKRRD
jgi:choline dehydrogenase